MSYNLIVRILVVILAIVAGYVLYNYVIKPYVLDPTCLTNSNRCVRLSYQNYKNSALIHMQPTGFWIWFNGMKAYVFSPVTGKVCEDDKHEPAYEVDPITGIPHAYGCITKLDDLQKFYDGKSEKKKYIYHRSKDPNAFNVYDVLNLLGDKGILNLKNVSPKTVTKI